MSAVGDAAFEVLRRTVRGVLSASFGRLDLSGRARALSALDQPQGGLLEGMLPRPLRAAFLDRRPEVDTEVVGRLLRAVVGSLGMSDREPDLLRVLSHATLVDGRGALGWPEVVMAQALLAEEGAPAVEEVLDAYVSGRALRLVILIEALLHLERQEHGRREVSVDEEARPLYRGLDGQPTHTGWVEVPTLNTVGDEVFVAPPEMQRDPFVRAYSRSELWTRHFSRLSGGDEKLEAWLRDPLRRVRHRQKLPLLDAPAPHLLERLLPLREDAMALFVEATALSRELRALASLEEEPSIFADLGDSVPLRRALRDARDRLKDALRELTDRFVASEPELASIAPYRGLFDDALPESSAQAVAREPFGTLLERLAIARVLDPWLRNLGAGSVPTLDAIHPSLLGRVRERARSDWVTLAVPALLVALLRTEAMRRRGIRAFGAIDEGQSGVPEELALELALSGLDRAIDALVSAPSEDGPPRDSG